MCFGRPLGSINNMLLEKYSQLIDITNDTTPSTIREGIPPLLHLRHTLHGQSPLSPVCNTRLTIRQFLCIVVVVIVVAVVLFTINSSNLVKILYRLINE